MYVPFGYTYPYRSMTPGFPGFPGAGAGFPGGGPMMPPPGGFPPGTPPGPFPGGGPFPPGPGGGGPLGPGAGGGPGQPGAPTSPPPAFTPTKPPQQLFAVDPGSISRCLFRYVYIWQNNGDSYWMYLTFVGRNSLAGYRWIGFGPFGQWRYFGIDLNRIQQFTCFG